MENRKEKGITCVSMCPEEKKTCRWRWWWGRWECLRVAKESNTWYTSVWYLSRKRVAALCMDFTEEERNCSAFSRGFSWFFSSPNTTPTTHNTKITENIWIFIPKKHPFCFHLSSLCSAFLRSASLSNSQFPLLKLSFEYVSGSHGLVKKKLPFWRDDIKRTESEDQFEIRIQESNKKGK